MENEKLRFQTIAKSHQDKSITSIPIIFDAIVLNGKTYYKLVCFDGVYIDENILIAKNIIDAVAVKNYSHTFTYEQIVYYVQID